MHRITGLSGWNIFLDPGHSQKENMGIFNYSEAEKKTCALLCTCAICCSPTPISIQSICRARNDTQVVSLDQRTTRANSLGAAWFHSIHSDAGRPTNNSTLLLWGQYRDGRGKSAERRQGHERYHDRRYHPRHAHLYGPWLDRAIVPSTGARLPALICMSTAPRPCLRS